MHPDRKPSFRVDRDKKQDAWRWKCYGCGEHGDAPAFPLPEQAADMLRVDLATAGIPVRTMMRHSTLELTGRYTRPRMHDLAGAVESLPDLASPEPRTETATLAATGTEVQRIGEVFAHH